MTILAQITLPARLDSLGSLMEVVTGCARVKGLDHKRIVKIEIAVEEALVNIFKYAYASGTGDVRLSCLYEPGRFIVEIRDRGVPFDILSQKQPDITAGIEERKVGGLGVFLMKSMVDDAYYRREGGENVAGLIVFTQKTGE